VPAGTVGHEDGLCALGHGAGDPGEVGIHGLRVDPRHDQRGGGAAPGAQTAPKMQARVQRLSRDARGRVPRGASATVTAKFF
jgi:hypothetical protein